MKGELMTNRSSLLPRVLKPLGKEANRTAYSPTRQHSCARHQVIRLEKEQSFNRVVVQSGVLWLTGAPANGDVLLRAGQAYSFENCWPYVIEALEASEFLLL